MQNVYAKFKMLVIILLFPLSSSRCFLFSCFVDEVLAWSEPSSGLVASFIEPGDIRQSIHNLTCR